MRALLGVLITSTKNFQRQSIAIIDVRSWMAMGYALATDLRDSTESALAKIQEDIAVSRLAATDTPLQDDLDDLQAAVDAVAKQIHNAVNAFWSGSAPPRPDDPEVQSALQFFESSAAKLHADALVALRPTIRERTARPPKAAIRTRRGARQETV